jgi:hypothetical protein
MSEGRAHLLVCREGFSDGDCLRPATHICGSKVPTDPISGYPACAGCASFWANECVYHLMEHDHKLLELAARWASVPVSEHPSKLAAVVHQRYRSRAA